MVQPRILNFGCNCVVAVRCSS